LCCETGFENGGKTVILKHVFAPDYVEEKSKADKPKEYKSKDHCGHLSTVAFAVSSFGCKHGHISRIVISVTM
jgi:hypothetical protein